MRGRAWHRGMGYGVLAAGVVLLLCVVESTGVAASPAVPSASPTHLDPANVIIHYFTVGLGKDPSGGVYDTKNANVYIACAGSNNVTAINSTTHDHSSIAVGKDPVGIIFDPDNRNLYVVNLNSSSVSVISGATNKVTTTVSLGKDARPLNAIFDPATGGLFVLNSSKTSGGNAWLIANTTNKVTDVALPAGNSYSLAYSPSSKELYIPGNLTESVSAVSATGTVKTLALPFYASVAYYSPASKDLLVTGTDLAKPFYPAEVEAFDSTDKVVKTFFDTTVNYVIPPLELYGIQAGTAYDPVDHDVYFAGYNATSDKSYSVVISSSNSLLSTIHLSSGAVSTLGSSFFFPSAGDMYMGSTATGGVYVLNGTKLVTTIKTSQPVYFFTFDPAYDLMYGAGDPSSGNSILYDFTNTNSIFATLTVGKDAVAFTYDAKDTYVYVVNVGSDTVEAVT